MRWRSSRRSSNVEDRRRGGTSAKVGGLGLVVTLVVAWFMGASPTQLIGMATNNMLSSGGGSGQPSAAQQESADFVSAVLAQTEDVWNPLLQQAGVNYDEPNLVLFNDQVQSACGFASSATGPFYCPGDEKVYIDLGFFNELKRMGASGEFARAYVLGHEVAHHVQNQLGISSKISRLQARSSKTQSNALSVRLELQADCLAGVWAHHAHQRFDILEPGDIENGLQAAASIGDDRLQRMSGRPVNPDSFTHGTSQQRVNWFTTGLKSGDLNRCDTFSGDI